MTEPAKPSVVVALPHPDDPVHKMGSEPSHVTLMYLGPNDQVDEQAANEAVAKVAGGVRGPMTDAVSGHGELGPDKAQVLLMDGHHLGGIRQKLMEQPALKDMHDAADQFPVWLPHLTVGYPAEGDAVDGTPDQVSFDRLAVWHGGSQTEHPMGAQMTQPNTVEAEPDTEESVMLQPTPWYGVLVPEGTPSGDKRSFAKGALTHRDLPLRLTWQKASDSGHRGSVVVGSIEDIYRHDGGDGPNEMRAYGYFLQNPEADEVIGQAAEFGNLGVSVDSDDLTFEVDEENGSVNFSQARICSAAVCTIPAFPQAMIHLGEPPEGFMGQQPAEAGFEDDGVFSFGGWCSPSETDFAISEKPWDGSASRFTPEEYKRSCILHRDSSLNKASHSLPIREPNGDLSRAGVHAAAARVNQVQASPAAKGAARSALRSAYKQLGETPPESLSAETGVAEFARGPGWVTNPIATRRIHDYWTVPGQAGYAKIGWGTPGDFNRCKVEIGQEIAEKTPEKLRYINQQCAQWQHDAIGVWPGRGEKLSLEGEAAPAISLVASALPKEWVPRFEWFSDPGLTDPTLIQFEDHPEGTRVFGHLGEWNACHLDFPGVCVNPPRLLDGGENFMVHRVLTDGGYVYTGQITLGGGHADEMLGLLAAREHYDDVSSVKCDVVVGEDDIGIWFSGWLRPDATPQDRFQLYAAQLSGDWRDKHGSLVLIAAHAVVSAGFTIKPITHVRNGFQTALVAAGGLAARQAPKELPGMISSVTTFTDGHFTWGTPLETLSAPEPEELIAAGIRKYREQEEAKQRVTAAVEQVGADPKARIERLKES